jgi:predicted dehydrogenase
MSKTNYALDSGDELPQIEAPELAYRPVEPKNGPLRIGLIGCGGISETHLQAYRQAGYQVPILCDRNLSKAEHCRDQFYPQAEVTADYQTVLDRADIEIVDLTPHPAERSELIEAALLKGKHVLSQKPFVTDLNVGRQLVELAHSQGLKLAINQNGRWAPHFAYLREVVRAGLIGRVSAVRLAVHWDHNWIRETPFDQVHHILLYDFGIHWFDFACSLLEGRQARSVYATVTRSPTQQATPPLLAQAVIDYDDAQVSLVLDADTPVGPEDHTFIVGSSGSAQARGPDLSRQAVTVATASGQFSPQLEGTWFPDGFHGAMAELMCAIEEDRPPLHSARENLTTLSLCFAAVESAERHQPVDPLSVAELVKKC